MITAILEVQLAAARLDDAPAIIHDVLTATRAFEGSLGVEVLQDAADPAHFAFIERWASMEADAAYRAWRSTPEGASALAEVLAQPPTLTRFSSRDDI